ncbi:MAG TPA: MFS transporter [Pseudonocardiaceae bacterium]|jgi:MFS family permease|nr:MFS transporter [Pseudonocardiaceae bacterium]
MTALSTPAPTTTTTRRLPTNLVVPIALGTLLQALNSSMIAVALVQIRDAFHAGASASWLISGLYLATAVGAPTMGRLADVIGPRKVFLGGLAVVAVAAVAAPFAPNIGTLILCRVLLGIGTSAPYPAGIAMIRAEADRTGIGNVAGGLGVLTVAGQVAVAFGPTLGGLLVQVASWPAIFLVNVPFVLVAGFFAFRYLPADRPRHAVSARDVLHKLDIGGLLLFSGAMTALMLVLLSLTNSPQWYLLPVFAIFGGALVLRERRAPEPFIDVQLLATNRSLSFTYLRTALTYVAFYAVFYGLPSWLEQGRGLDPGTAGLVMLPLAAVGVLTTTLAARLVRHRGPRVLLVIGSLVFVAAALALTRVDSTASIIGLVGISALLGLPNGFNSMGNQTSLYLSAPKEQMGAASGLYRSSQYVGANLAAALLELTFAGPSTDPGLHRTAFAILAIVAVLAVTAITSKHLRNT